MWILLVCKRDNSVWKKGTNVLRGESREIRTQLRDIFRRLSIFNDTFVTMQADYRDIYDRVREIEGNAELSHTESRLSRPHLDARFRIPYTAKAFPFAVLER